MHCGKSPAASVNELSSFRWQISGVPFVVKYNTGQYIGHDPYPNMGSRFISAAATFAAAAAALVDNMKSANIIW